MLWIKKVIENQALMSGLMVIGSNFVPILIMICTFRFQKKRYQEEFRIREKEFQDTIERNEKYHQESMSIQEENNRISQIPYLLLNRDFKIGTRKENYIFPLEIKNIGNGIALDIKIKWEEDRQGDRCQGLPYVYQRQISEYIEYYRYSDFLSTNVLQINAQASFELLLDICNEEMLLREKGMVSSEVCFTIAYKDAYYNEYEQKYMFQYSTGIGIGRVETYVPQLMKGFIR
jgi:hypothetical protein